MDDQARQKGKDFETWGRRDMMVAAMVKTKAARGEQMDTKDSSGRRRL